MRFDHDRLKREDELDAKDYGDYMEMNKHFIEWRNWLFPNSKYNEGPDSYNNNDLIVNFPIYDSHHHDESDFFVFSGYMRPGTHSLIIYDPVTD